ncbi:HEAT repeat domain-containing protein [Breznakiellaceae bacterium SP9]
MALAILNELNNELIRVTIAGSALAKDDPRIKKYIPAVQKLGEKAPVFAVLADKLQALTQGAAQESPEALLEAGVLLYSLRYTQGKTDIEGEAVEPDTAAGLIQHKIPYSTFIKVYETYKSSERALRRLIAAKLHTDPRFFPFYSDCFFNRNTPAYSLIVDEIIPGIGRAIVPELLRKLDLKGNVQHAAIFKTLYQLEGKDILPLAEKALAEADTPVKVEALRALGDDAKYEDTLIEYTADKKADIRGAALNSLIKMQSNRVEQIILTELDKKQIGFLETALCLSQSQAVLAKMLEQGQTLLPEWDKNTAKLKTLLRVFARRNESAGLAIIKDLLSDNALYAKMGNPLDLDELLPLLVHADEESGPLPSLEKLELLYALPEHNSCSSRYQLQAAVKLFPPDKVYDIYAPKVKKEKGGWVKTEKGGWTNYVYYLMNAYGVDRYSVDAAPVPDAEKNWDRRWGELLYTKIGLSIFEVLSFIYADDKKLWDKMLHDTLKEAERKKKENIGVTPHVITAGVLLSAVFQNKYPQAQEYYDKFLHLYPKEELDDAMGIE